jgi:SAM-dependent methyltransferase
MLDMGTGGGEWLASLAYRAPRTVATESWEPNVAVATSRLRPLGIDVVQVKSAPDNVEPDEDGGDLPFPDGSFELVTNRHESFVAHEVARVLARDGRFLTQQLGDGVFAEFADALGVDRPARRRWTLELATQQVGAAGLEIVSSAVGHELVTFADVGALAWYLRMVPWTIAGFSIAAFRSRLHELQTRVPLTLPLPAFYLEAVKR